MKLLRWLRKPCFFFDIEADLQLDLTRYMSVYIYMYIVFYIDVCMYIYIFVAHHGLGHTFWRHGGVAAIGQRPRDDTGIYNWGEGWGKAGHINSATTQPFTHTMICCHRICSFLNSFCLSMHIVLSWWKTIFSFLGFGQFSFLPTVQPLLIDISETFPFLTWILFAIFYSKQNSIKEP